MAGTRGQLDLDFERRRGRRGGAREGAGRPPLPGGPRSVPHRARPRHRHYRPLHVTMRAGVRDLRAQRVFAAIRGAFARAIEHREHFRVVQFSVQDNHVHLVVEAADNRALTAGMRGLAVSIARRVNPLLHRRGALWRERYHARALTSPRAVRHALVYVLNNARKHDAEAGWIDECSSGAWFDGWRDDDAVFAALIARVRAGAGPPLVADPETWLGTIGWRRSRGPIGVNESPARRRGRAASRHVRR